MRYVKLVQTIAGDYSGGTQGEPINTGELIDSFNPTISLNKKEIEGIVNQTLTMPSNVALTNHKTVTYKGQILPITIEVVVVY